MLTLPRLCTLILVLAVSSLPAVALADDATSVATSADVAIEGDTGIVGLIGPQLSMIGPPTAFKVQAQFWHEFYDDIGFYAGLAMAFGGETTIESDDAGIPDAHYDSTVGAEFATGVRWVLSFLEMPFETYVRGAIAVDLTGGDQLIGYMIGPSAAIGLTYPIADGLSLVVDGELGVGYGQYRAEQGTFAATFDLLVGAQMAF